MTKLVYFQYFDLFYFCQVSADGDLTLANQPGIVYLQTTVTNEHGEVTQQMIPVNASALQVGHISCTYFRSLILVERSAIQFCK